MTDGIQGDRSSRWTLTIETGFELLFQVIVNGRELFKLYGPEIMRSRIYEPSVLLET